jgi:hypothetical protein
VLSESGSNTVNVLHVYFEKDFVVIKSISIEAEEVNLSDKEIEYYF